VVFVWALAPSGWLAWQWRAVPQLGLHHDDALYLVGAKSLAEGHGYRIESLPGSPFQTKYPPVFSALLTLVWRFDPRYPENSRLALVLSWLALPPFLLALRAVFRDFGLGRREAAFLTLAAAFYPVVCLLSTSVMSDLVFLSLLLASTRAAEKALNGSSSRWLAPAAGVIAGFAYLTRTAALVLAVTAPLCFLWRKQGRRAFLFLAGMLPFVAGWQVWVSTHLAPTRDPALLYYTNYMALQRATVRLDNLASVVWYNFDALLRSIGKLLVFDVALRENVHLERILGIAALAGAVRLVKRRSQLQYPAAAAGTAVLLLVYFYTADERLCLPLYPLVLMGFWTEVKNCAAALVASWRRCHVMDRALAAGAALVLGGLGIFVGASYVVGDAVFLPAVYAACQTDRKSHESAYEWIRRTTHPQSTFYAYNDPLLYLHTGRKALGLTMPSGRIYTGEGEKKTDEFLRSIPQNACAHGVDHLLVTDSDFYREGSARLLREVADRDPGLLPEYRSADAVIYRCVR